VFAYGVAKGWNRCCGSARTTSPSRKYHEAGANLNFEIGIYLPGTRIQDQPGPTSRRWSSCR